ncbi:hypothetical protein QJS10_CPB22g01307 [Acorus calamus]|uniref:Uncharacterized protein n=1 Tax=Acorus calamus TaxID=4465 RepID=A0AAV9C1K6_ACOCL|nr:hypothetical protein QJS10_CPB22g01307 [Acorus calamus]
MDDTLYSSKVGIAQIVRRNIDSFLVKICGFSSEEAPVLRADLFRTYGSSLAGLRALGHDVDADDYHSYVHGSLPYDSISPDPKLRELLNSIAQTKIVFTNSDRNHATRVLDRLGVRDCFDAVVCFETLNADASGSAPVVLKPSIEAMRTAVNASGFEPRRTLFLDDNERNIAAGKAAGLRTALVGKTVKTNEADYVVESIINLRKAIPEIWRGEQRIEAAKMVHNSRSEMDSALTTTSVEA